VTLSNPPLSRLHRAALTLIIATGLGLRLAWPETTVFCEDQVEACALAEDIAHGHWQTAGLINSGGFRNPPGFVYLLAAVWRLSSEPVSLVIFIAAANVLAVMFSAWLIRRWFSGTAAWWGTAFLAAGPWAIQYSRWIWAQDLMFPAAVVVYWFLWRWTSLGKRWSATGVVLALALLMQIHLIGIVLTVALALLLIWRRRKLPLWPLAVGLVIAVASILPYLFDGHLAAPNERRFGYEHFWRVVPAAAMSVSGLHWQLEFRDGYAAFAASLGWRRWPYELFMVVPVIVLAVAVVMGLGQVWRQRRAGPIAGQYPASWVTALVVLIPLSFVLLGIRTSPTYLPIWYPLPFALMGWSVARLSVRCQTTAPYPLVHGGRGNLLGPPGILGDTPGRQRGSSRGASLIAPVLIAVLAVQLVFFAEQLHYIHSRGGVPGSTIGRSYAGMKTDIAAVPPRLTASEVWMIYEGPSEIQDDPAAYLLRHAQVHNSIAGRQLVRFRCWKGGDQAHDAVRMLTESESPPDTAYLIHPWPATQQMDGTIPRRLRPAGE